MMLGGMALSFIVEDYTKLLEKEMGEYEKHVKIQSFFKYFLFIAIIGLVAFSIIYVRRRRK